MKAYVTVDLGFGDAGKGTVVDRMCWDLNSHTVVRYNGGPQAAHNVVTSDGRHHVFAQFGSGTLAGARTHLSRFMLVNPLNMVREADHLRELGCKNPWSLLTVDEDALVITPYHVVANRILENYRDRFRHGSCGEGIGQAVEDSLKNDVAVRVKDLRSERTLQEKFGKLQELKRPLCNLTEDPPGILTMGRTSVLNLASQYRNVGSFLNVVDGSYLSELARIRDGSVLFEGAQGVLLDETHGFQPYTTWSNTTLENALLLCEDADLEPTTLGILRGYMVRHGPGPFPTESEWLTKKLPDPHNEFNQWQREFRVGHFDAVLARYAAEMAGKLDALAITCLDRLYDVEDLWVANSYFPEAGDRHPYAALSTYTPRMRSGIVHNAVPGYLRMPGLASGNPYDYPEALADLVGIKLAMTSWGPTCEDKVWHAGTPLAKEMV